jgi:dTDP-4-amino-4,6-dideoxygalactose transaminase
VTTQPLDLVEVPAPRQPAAEPVAQPGWRVPYIRPEFPSAQEVSEDLAQIVAANWYTNFGRFERQFCAELARYVGADRHAATVSSATTGLMAALKLLLPDSDKRSGLVIVASYTFAAGPAAIRWAGHRPLFVDVDEQSLQPSLASAHQAIARYGDQVVGILLGNSFGIGNAEIDDWERLADTWGLPLVIDSAAGFGSQYADGSRVGVGGDCEVFSFHATKPFAVGEGGAVLCRDEELAARVRSFTNFGFVDHNAVTIGMNGKLQELNAAIGLRQLDRYERALWRRRRTFAHVRDASAGAGLEFPAGQDRSSVGATIALAQDEAHRDRLLAALHAAGVEARVYYAPAVHVQPAFADEERVSDLAGTERVCARVLALPVHQTMSPDDLDLMVDVIHASAPRM